MKRLSQGLVASIFLHLSLYGAALGLIAWSEAHAEYHVDIDQTNAPLLTLGSNIQPPPPENWILAKKAKAPLAQPTPTPEPVTAIVTSRQPSWVGGLITQEDYPVGMKCQNKEGKVVAEVLIDVEGYVKAVSIIHGSEPEFNEVVLEKLKAARFKPALDLSGKPINCRVRVPISFKLN